jgi:putative hydrolase of the HAD superfamily
MIQAVIFDLFGTLVQQFPLDRFEESLRRMGQAVGLRFEEILAAWTKETSFKRHTGGFPSFREELLAICESRGIKPSEEGLTEAVHIRWEFTRSILIPRHDAVATLREVRSRGLRTGLISDCSLEVPELWRETPFAGLFDVTVFSCRVGTKKPDPRIYAAACEALGVLPSGCVYVGDGFSRELHGAESVGMRPLLLQVPSEPLPQTDEWEGHDWDGERIPALGEIVSLLDVAGSRRGRS